MTADSTIGSQRAERATMRRRLLDVCPRKQGFFGGEATPVPALRSRNLAHGKKMQ